jgi:hypothetical protein
MKPVFAEIQASTPYQYVHLQSGHLTGHHGNPVPLPVLRNPYYPVKEGTIEITFLYQFQIMIAMYGRIII